MNLSSREICVLLCYGALTIASLYVGGWLTSLTLIFGCILASAIAIVAMVGERSQRVFGRGFLVHAIAYSFIVLAGGYHEMDPMTGRLPTTRMFLWVQSNLAKHQDIADANYGSSDGGLAKSRSAAVLGTSETSMYLNEFRGLSNELMLSHLAFALFLGWMGGKFAQGVARESIE
ncbi:MAG: hypothetical protein U0905_17215 [Pirellulales bacterium]